MSNPLSRRQQPTQHFGGRRAKVITPAGQALRRFRRHRLAVLGVRNTMLIIGLLNWPVPCRLVRAKFLSLRNQEFVQAARAIGCTPSRTIAVHAFPNTVDVLVVYASFGIVNAILLEAGLSFLGLGVQPPTASWGNMLNVARNIDVLQ